MDIENLTAAYGVFPNTVEVREVVGILNHAGFENEHICMLFAPTHPIAVIVRDARLIDDKRQAVGAAAELIGWLAAFGAVVIPSIGFFIRSHAFSRTLLAARDTPALCGNLQTFTGLGFTVSDAERLGAQLQRAGFLVYVASKQRARAHWAVELFRRTGAEESGVLEERTGAAVA